MNQMQEYHQERASRYFHKYLELQTKIDGIEKRVKDASGNKSVAKLKLADWVDHESGSMYKDLCSERDAYMRVAQLSATMALMLKG